MSDSARPMSRSAPPQTTSLSGATNNTFGTILFPRWPVRMGNGMFALLMVVAGIADALQAVFLFFNAIPIIGTMIALFVPFMTTLFAFAIILPVFFASGIQVLSGKKAVANGSMLVGSFVVEAVPFLSTLPMLSAFTIRLFLSSRIEDAERAYKKQAEAKRGAQALDAQFISRQREQEQALQVAALSEREDSIYEEEVAQGRGEAGPAPNTLVIPKKKLPTQAYPTTLPIPKAESTPSARSETPWHG